MNAVVKIDGKPSLIATMAQRFGIDQDRMLVTLKATAFRGDVSTEQLMALCLVANAYNLNPWTKEIYALPDRNNGIVPVVGVRRRGRSSATRALRATSRTRVPISSLGNGEDQLSPPFPEGGRLHKPS